MGYVYKAVREFDENGIPLESITITEFDPQTRRLNREIEITGSSICIRWRKENSDWGLKGLLLTHPEIFEKIFNFIYEAVPPGSRGDIPPKIYQYAFKNNEVEKWRKTNE